MARGRLSVIAARNQRLFGVMFRIVLVSNASVSAGKAIHEHTFSGEF
jgi:hypothetical protein